MKKTLSIIAAIIAVNLTAETVHAFDKRLYDAIAIVESNNNSRAIGDGGRAIGAFQLWKVYVDDVNRIAGTSYTYEDRWDRQKSYEMAVIYVEYYSRRYERITGLRATREVKSRIHNGGPNGWKKPATEKYWRKVQKVLSK